MTKARSIGFFEEYVCGCISDTEKRRKDLLGYCAKHGADRRHVFKHWVRNDGEDGIVKQEAKHDEAKGD